MTFSIPAPRAALLVLLGALAGCQPTAEEKAARNDARTDAGTPPGNSTKMTHSSSNDPTIANTAEASALKSRASAAATPGQRSESRTKGPGAPDTSGRSHQERPRNR